MQAKRGRPKNNKKQQKGGGPHVLWLSDNFLVVKITLHDKNSESKNECKI
jgi:hypothetical protein